MAERSAGPFRQNLPRSGTSSGPDKGQPHQMKLFTRVKSFIWWGWDEEVVLVSKPRGGNRNDTADFHLARSSPDRQHFARPAYMFHNYRRDPRYEGEGLWLSSSNL
jgi:hypothetical protein